MNRKTVILLLSVLAAMVGVIAIAVALLYSNDGAGDARSSDIAEESRYMLLPAVPSDAVALLCLSDASDARSLTPFGEFDCRMAVSLHFSGKLVPLYVLDAGKASEQMSKKAGEFVAKAKEAGMACEFLNCSAIAPRSSGLNSRSIVIASPSEVILRSARRHIEKNVSILDLHDFAEAASSTSSSDVLFICNDQSSRLLTSLLKAPSSSLGSFASSFAKWTVAGIDSISEGGISLTATTISQNDAFAFAKVLSSNEYGSLRYPEILPSYTFSAVSIPVSDIRSYIDSYMSYLDSRQRLQSYKAAQKSLERSVGISPEEFLKELKVQEVATASFVVSSKLQRVNLMRVGDLDKDLLFKGNKIDKIKDEGPGVLSFAYPDLLASVFGNIFSIDDEGYFTYKDGWVISGSRTAVEEYVTGKALEYPLGEYLADAGKDSFISTKQTALSCYLCPGASETFAKALFTPNLLDFFKTYEKECDFCPVSLNYGAGKDRAAFRVELRKMKLRKAKAPVYERDTTVIIPKGPFRVKNSGTGKMNLFYQQDNLYLCLKEEGGKGLWGIPFDGKLCGTAGTIDYYANGKLQILFGAGSRIYLIDRLGRFVKGFPVELGKDILLGPAAYDFNGIRKYNIMVLHKDNTIEMYDLKGRKPSSWKGIHAPETVKSLPERVKVGDRSFWVVRTSIRTLIYPFEGGEPLTTGQESKMLRPDTEVRVLDSGEIEFDCYDGKTRTIVL